MQSLIQQQASPRRLPSYPFLSDSLSFDERLRKRQAPIILYGNGVDIATRRMKGHPSRIQTYTSLDGSTEELDETWQYRSHQPNAGWTENFGQANADPSGDKGFFITAPQNGTKGDFYVFKAFNPETLDGKTLNLTYAPMNSGLDGSFFVKIYDGTYDRASAADFPLEQALATKGNGLLDSHALPEDATGTPRTEQLTLTATGGTEQRVTLMLMFNDRVEVAGVSHEITWQEVDILSVASWSWDNALWSRTVESSAVNSKYGTSNPVLTQV